MNYKKILESFIEGLNALNKDKLCSPYKEKEGEFKLYSENRQGMYVITLYYNEKNYNHCIYIRKKLEEINDSETIDAIHKEAYFEILRYSLFAIDSVGKLKDVDSGATINILSIQTLISKGLEKIRK